MKRLFLIKRKRELVIDIEEVSVKKKRVGEDGGTIKITSIVMISRRIDEFEDNIRKKMESEMRIYSCKVHSQEFLRSLIPSFNKDRRC